MNRIDNTFAELKKSGEKALIAFITAGDPDLEATALLLPAIDGAGADIIEIGVPFSDPIAEGAAIQLADIRALKNGVNLPKIFSSVGKIRGKIKAPLIMALYLNSIFHYGAEKFFAECAEKGIDGVLIYDMPYEAKEEFYPPANKNGVIIISVAAPASERRLDMIAAAAEGFVFCAVNPGDAEKLTCFTNGIKTRTPLPVVIESDVLTDDLLKLSGCYDGISTGGALAESVSAGGSGYIEAAAKKVAAFKQSLQNIN